jgi:hypothetical protein
MNIGMLWFDNDPKTELPAKVERAAAYYRNKYGRTPTLCFVHPSMISSLKIQGSENGGFQSNGVEIRSARTVLPNHLWIGVNALNAA